mmetsp:Transcript_13192/g.36186  ORF Transcript_13192/g.36186 Transcript_13192/m.36186 type:complete len:99 (-) Transcript_13192:26-322(-)
MCWSKIEWKKHVACSAMLVTTALHLRLGSSLLLAVPSWSRHPRIFYKITAPNKSMATSNCLFHHVGHDILACVALAISVALSHAKFQTSSEGTPLTDN